MEYHGTDIDKNPSIPSYFFKNSQYQYELLLDHDAQVFRGYLEPMIFDKHIFRELTERECRLLAIEGFPFVYLSEDYEFDDG